MRRLTSAASVHSAAVAAAMACSVNWRLRRTMLVPALSVVWVRLMDSFDRGSGAARRLLLVREAEGLYHRAGGLSNAAGRPPDPRSRTQRTNWFQRTTPTRATMRMRYSQTQPTDRRSAPGAAR